MPVAAHVPVASSGSFLITPNVGLMVWVLVVFGKIYLVLRKWVLPALGAALDARAEAIADSIDSAENLRKQAEQVLSEYRQRLAEARVQADEIVSRARQAGEAHQKETVETARAERERLLEQTRRDVERDAPGDRRDPSLGADLTVLATEKVTARRSPGDDQKRLVDDALTSSTSPPSAEVRLAVGAYVRTTGRTHGRDRPGIRTVAVRGRLGTGQARHGQRAARSVRRRSPREPSARRFLLLPYFSTEEKKNGLSAAVAGGDPALHELPGGADRAPSDAGRSTGSGPISRSSTTRPTNCCR